MQILETIKIEHKDGFALINKADFDVKKHKEFKEKPAKVEPTKKGKK